jgi:hypothetical protein
MSEIPGQTPTRGNNFKGLWRKIVASGACFRSPFSAKNAAKLIDIEADIWRLLNFCKLF